MAEWLKRGAAADIAAVGAFFDGRAPFHVLVNNAGTNRPMPMQDVDEADYDAVLGLNLKAAFFVAQGCARRLIARVNPAASSTSAARWAMSAAQTARSTARRNGGWRG